MAEWYCEVGGQRYGPVSEQELRDWLAQGRLSGHDVVWRQGMSEWMPVSSVPELSGGLGAQAAAGAPLGPRVCCCWPPTGST